MNTSEQEFIEQEKHIKKILEDSFDGLPFVVSVEDFVKLCGNLGESN